MRMKLMQKRSSRIALLFTTLSFLANCDGQECGSAEVMKCVQPLKKYSNNNNFGLGTLTATKEELNVFCQEFNQGIKCIKSYTEKCLSPEEKKSFPFDIDSMFKPISEMFCEKGPLQDTYLRHASCLQTVKPEILSCAQTFNETVQAIAAEKRVGSSAAGVAMKSMCGAMQTYSDCTHVVVQSKCGEEAAKFTKDFVDRLFTLVMTQLKKASSDQNMYNIECTYLNGSSSLMGISLIQITLILLATYVT